MKVIVRGILLVCALMLPIAAEAQRVALVIGNSKYEHAGPLDNPGNDARDVAAAFVRQGIDAEVINDGTLSTMRQALDRLAKKAAAAELAVLYYSGHGIEMRGKNYLIPVDAKLEDDAAIEAETVAFEQAMASLEPAKSMRLVVLDACRNSPLVSDLKARGSLKAVGTGLAPVSPSDMLVAYATKHGQLAQDGPPGGHSPFTAAFLRHVERPGLDVRQLFIHVRDEVLQTTQLKQSPFTYGFVRMKEFSLVPPK